MGIVVMKLNEYRMDSGKTNSPLSHITVLEEAHNLLKRTSTEQSTEGANLLGKSVEMLSNSIAEMRTYGEGFIIADQSPGLMDMSVIRNTNTKIILRLPERSDRELVGFAAGLDEKQVDELSKLKRGVAAIYQSDWVAPVLVQVNKCEIAERAFSGTKDVNIGKSNFVLQQVLNLLIQGRVNEHLYFNLNEIENGLDSLKFSMQINDFIEEQLAEYRAYESLEIWRDEKFRLLSRRVTDIIGARSRVENCILTANTNDELSTMLQRIVEKCYPNAPEEVTLTLSQCLMKDMSVQHDEAEVRERLYMKWVDSIREKRM
jgi:type III secretion system FlhB-like substrate exporter